MAVQMSIDRNKSLNGNNQSYKVDANSEKMTENITPDDSDDSDKTESNNAILELCVWLEKIVTYKK